MFRTQSAPTANSMNSASASGAPSGASRPGSVSSAAMRPPRRSGAAPSASAEGTQSISRRWLTNTRHSARSAASAMRRAVRGRVVSPIRPRRQLSASVGRSSASSNRNSMPAAAASGRPVQAAAISISHSAGARRLRIRLSSMRNRSATCRGRFGENIRGNSCQSPRVQRCWRFIQPDSVAGQPSNSATSPTKPVPASAPSIRSWESMRPSGSLPATARWKSATR